MNENFKYTISKLDMKEIYSWIIKSELDIPEIIVVEENEDESAIQKVKMKNKNSLFYVQNSNNMQAVIEEALSNKSISIRNAMSFEEHDLTNSEMKIWLQCAVEISTLLDVPCPQILFTHGDNAGVFSGEGLMILPDKQDVVIEFVSIAHELRHEWQHKNHPEWFKGYISPTCEEDMDAYLNHKTEVDAETFARVIANTVFDIDLFENEPILSKKAQEISFCKLKELSLHLENLKLLF